MLSAAVRAVVSLPTWTARKALALLVPARPAGASAEAVRAPAGEASAHTRGGKYDEPLLRIAAERPGVTVAEAAAQIGVPATALYPPLRRLQEQARIVKRGRGLHPAD